MIALCKMGKGKSVMVGLLALLSRHFSLRKALPGFFPLYFHLGLPALGTDLKSRKGPILRRFSYTKCPHARQAIPVWSVLWALSLSWIVRNSTEHYLRCEESREASGDERHQFFPLVVVLSMLQEVWEDVKSAQKGLKCRQYKSNAAFLFFISAQLPE
jgi:hypothetical protein